MLLLLLFPSSVGCTCVSLEVLSVSASLKLLAVASDRNCSNSSSLVDNDTPPLILTTFCQSILSFFLSFFLSHFLLALWLSINGRFCYPSSYISLAGHTCAYKSSYTVVMSASQQSSIDCSCSCKIPLFKENP